MQNCTTTKSKTCPPARTTRPYSSTGIDTLVSYITVTRPPLPLSPTELVPPSTLHTDRPYIYSSTWVQAAPARSGVVSPYAVIPVVRYANWGPRGWPCPAGVGGDPPFPSMYTSPARRQPLEQLWGDRSTIGAPCRPHNRRASCCRRHAPPNVLPSTPSPTLVDQHTCKSACLSRCAPTAARSKPACTSQRASRPSSCKASRISCGPNPVLHSGCTVGAP